MSALHPVFQDIVEAHGLVPRTPHFKPTTFEAFRPSQALGAIDAETLDEALASALTTFGAEHKSHLIIRESGTTLVQWANSAEERPFVRLHIYAIKRKSQPRYVYRDHANERVHDLYPEMVCSIDGSVLA